TYGRVSRFGLVAYASSLDQIGPLALTAADTGLVMEVIGQHCEKDSTSLKWSAEDYLPVLNKDLKGFRIGVPRQFLEGLSSEARQVFDRSLQELEALGATLVDVDLSILKYALGTYYILATAEASTNLARFDGIRYGLRSARAKTLDEVYTF